jgi:D-lactate dehydrogenase (cytochrome)
MPSIVECCLASPPQQGRCERGAEAGPAPRHTQLNCAPLQSGQPTQFGKVTPAVIEELRTALRHVSTARDRHVLSRVEPPRSADRVATDENTLDQRSKDHSYHAPRKPDAVVLATSTADVRGARTHTCAWYSLRVSRQVSAALRICHRHRLPVVARGAGTGLEGGCIAIHGGVVIDMSRMTRVLELYTDELQASARCGLLCQTLVRHARAQVRVEAGIKKEALNDHLKEHGLFFPVDPSSNPSVGGMCATGSSGTVRHVPLPSLAFRDSVSAAPCSVKYGTMKENTVQLTAVLADGTVLRTRNRVRKNSTGYDLHHLLMGQEGTLAIVTEVAAAATPHICCSRAVNRAHACVCRAV